LPASCWTRARARRCPHAAAWHFCEAAHARARARPLTPRAGRTQVVKGPVTKLLPAGCRRVGFSRAAPSLVSFREYVKALPEGAPAVFVVGAMAHGALEVAYVDEWVAVSEFPLSAACCLGRITNALEDKWGVV